MKIRLGIDLGGTKANIGIFTEEGKLIISNKLYHPADKNPITVIKGIYREITKQFESLKLFYEDVIFCGIGLPGTVDKTGSVLLCAPNLGWENVKLADMFEKVTRIRPVLIQDAKAAALGEYFEDGCKSNLVLSVTVGTGIGCGIVYDGKVFHGALGSAGEIGHIQVVPGGRLCGCGRRGCVESYSSGSGILKSAKMHSELQGLTSCEEVFKLYYQGNEAAKEIVEQAALYLGQAMIAAVNLFSPDKVVFSGGLCLQTEYIDLVIKYIRENGYSLAVGDKLDIGISKLSESAPLIGAALIDKVL